MNRIVSNTLFIICFLLVGILCAIGIIQVVSGFTKDGPRPYVQAELILKDTVTGVVCYKPKGGHAISCLQLR